MMFHRFGLSILTYFIVLGTFAVSAAAQDPMRFSMINNHPSDKPAQVRLIAKEELKNVEVDITNCAPTVIHRNFAKLKRGEEQNISWLQKPGRFNCGIIITGYTGLGAKVSTNATYEFISGSSVGAPLSMTVDLNELKALTPTTDHIMLKVSRQFSRVELTVKAEDGSIIDKVDRNVAGQPNYKLTWKPSSKTPVLVDVRVSDEAGAWATSTIMSFMVPHTDVVFDTNKYNIRPDQEKYLHEPLEIIQDKVRKFDEVAVSLYITGHTDTVGSAKDNDKLSLNRARSIASWFRSHGLSIPTYYRGAGERDLAIQTPDNTDEERNRRAVYILTNSAPSDGLGGYAMLK